MCILMVEDESLILEIMSECLADAGYEVVTADNGPAAMAVLAERNGALTGLFSDYHLPGGLTGLDIARAVRGRYPSIPVILATGRPDVLDARWQSDEGFVMLRKPYRPSEILAALGRMVSPPQHGTT